jgi:N-acetylneuraminic acid mutarotase
MTSPLSVRQNRCRLTFATWLGVLASAILGQPAHPTAGGVFALRDRFPEEASRVLGEERPDRFVERGGRFVLAAPAAQDPVVAANTMLRRRAGLTASFPLTGDGNIEFRLGDGFAVQVREIRVRGRGRPDAAALMYPHDSGAVFWTFDRGGYEEWLLLERPRSGVVAQWEIAGAEPAQRGDQVAILDHTGRARLVVSAPEAYGADGTALKATLLVRGHVITLALDDRAEGQPHVLVDPSWHSVGSLDTSRVGNTATLLSTGKVLVAGGFGSQGSPANFVELYDPASGVWTDAAPMNMFRADHTATLLQNGKVLVAGGFDAGVSYTNTAELYDPVAGTWTPTGPLAQARTRHSATLLANGRVLIAGGTGPSGNLTSSEIYYPNSGLFSGTGPLNVTRSSHVAVRLTNGKVLAAGGRPTTSAELFDPQTGAWTFTGSMNNVHYFGHTATLLRNGRVLVAGGTGPGGSPDETSAAEIYRPSTSTWISTTALPVPRVSHTATLLPNGNVLVAGGYTGTTDADALHTQVYKVTSGTWEFNGDLTEPRHGHTATLMPDARVLIAGGRWINSTIGAEIFIYPELAELAGAGVMTAKRRFHTATALPNGKVLIAGGQNENFKALSITELFDPATGTFQPTGPLSVPRQRHTATLLPSGQVLVAGGSAGTTFYNTAELYDPVVGNWTPTGSLGAAREGHTATLLADGRVLVVGGNDAAGPLQSGELYKPSGAAWSPAPGVPGAARTRHTATLLRDNRVLVVGGNTGFATAEVYDGKVWSPTGPLPADHSTGHSATLLPNGRVLVVGGVSGGLALDSASLFHPGKVGGKWSATDALFQERTEHTATLLPSGRVLVAGGNEPSGRYTPGAFSEEYEPATGLFRLSNIIPIRQQASATLLSTGQVLLAGGNDDYYLGPPPTQVIDSADVYDEGRGAPASATPSLNPLSPATASPGDVRLFSGTGFTFPHEAASGSGASNSPTNYPLIRFERQDNEAVSFAPVSIWGVTFVNFDLAEATLPLDLQPGWHHVRVIVNGVASASQPLLIQ